jgi:hypothetical protein
MAKVHYKQLVEEGHEVNETTELRMKLDENTSNGNMYLGLREYKTSGGYTGYTKSGLSFRVESVEDVDKLEKVFSDFISKCRKEISKE